MLLSYLRDSHPTLVTNTALIAERADPAAEAYGEAIHAGMSHIEVDAAADEALYCGLHFSPYNALVRIL